VADSGHLLLAAAFLAKPEFWLQHTHHVQIPNVNDRAHVANRQIIDWLFGLRVVVEPLHGERE